ncbi:nuclear transport factor 2 family protein [Croceivirga sp. JEA036]|uniref:nuclear transport factor 2 family protein n=1 Tax=Croceivirga sp. JEA036 TaxID=2721162 RepID=UPI00143B412B|nr:nuclear transport factor 2 family protein [Croceivirga sp. JEA036]NJB37717.1 nuclear transport factor 2 family protein [Croceivirga sp. JEA036]
MQNVLSLSLLLLLLNVHTSWCQLNKTDELYKLLAKKDSLLFDAAFKTCNTDYLDQLFTEDFEFYHDKGGFTEGKEAFLRPMQEACNRRGSRALPPAKRHLVTDSFKVYPLYKKEVLYGAIQHGVHSFSSLDQNQTYKKGDIAKFTHIWIIENGEWKLKRELSYDHQLQQ